MLSSLSSRCAGGLFPTNVMTPPPPPPSSQTIRGPSASPSFRLSPQFGSMTHFCPVRCEGKSCWEVSGKSLLSLETALGRHPPLLLRALLRLAVPPGRGRMGQGPSGERPGEGGEEPAGLSEGGSRHLHVAKVPGRAHVETHTCVHKAASTLHMGGFPSLLWRSSAVLSCHKKFIASPPLKSAQPSLLGFKVTALQINTNMNYWILLV